MGLYEARLGVRSEEKRAVGENADENTATELARSNELSEFRVEVNVSYVDEKAAHRENYVNALQNRVLFKADIEG